MLKEKNSAIAVRALNEGTDHARYFNRILEESQYGDHTAITPMYLKDINCSCTIVLSDEVFDTIRAISAITRKYNLEVPFFLFGREEVGGIVYFHTAKYCSRNLERHYANFNPLSHGVDYAMYGFLQDNAADLLLRNYGSETFSRFKRAVRCYGHTHSPDGGGDQFSFADLSCTVEHVLINKYYSSNEMSSMDLLITPSGDLNFIKYEQNMLFEGFYKYRRVYVIKNDGKVYRIPAYENGDYKPRPIKKRAKNKFEKLIVILGIAVAIVSFCWSKIRKGEEK